MDAVTAIFRQHGPGYLEKFGARLPPHHREAILDICQCRTPIMGSHLIHCADCENDRLVHHSCRNRACPVCHAKETRRWLSARAEALLPVRYFHLVITLPSERRRPTRDHPEVALEILMKTAAETIQGFLANPRFGGGLGGILMVLHSWTQGLIWHPHVHCLIPAVVLGETGEAKRIRGRYLFPLKEVGKVFRARFTQACRNSGIPELVPLESEWKKDWVLFCRRCDEGPEKVLRYLARYACRGPMASRRIISHTDTEVVLECRDRESGRLRLVHLSPEEFLRRYLQHALPKGFHRIRHYGLLAPGNGPVLRQLQLHLAPARLVKALTRLREKFEDENRPPACPACGSTRLISSVLNYRDPSSRDPPK